MAILHGAPAFVVGAKVRWVPACETGTVFEYVGRDNLFTKGLRDQFYKVSLPDSIRILSESVLEPLTVSGTCKDRHHKRCAGCLCSCHWNTEGHRNAISK